MKKLSVSLVVPVLDEVERIEKFLRFHRRHHDFDEMIAVDGGSRDGTVPLIRKMDGVRLVKAPSGRGIQLSRGVRSTTSEYVLMLHVDGFIEPNFRPEKIQSIPEDWGWLKLKIAGSGWKYRLLEQAINRRSLRWMNPTGDQAIWVHREMLEMIAGIPEIPLMEDIELTDRLLSVGPGRMIDVDVKTSPRRWEENGFWNTVIHMWKLRLRYRLGAKPERLYERYYA